VSIFNFEFVTFCDSELLVDKKLKKIKWHQVSNN